VDAWHDVFVVLGTTAAALEGLVFVAVSVGVTLKQPRKGLAEFTGQTVINFTLALVACVVALSPVGLKIIGAVLLAPGILGLGSGLWGLVLVADASHRRLRASEDRLALLRIATGH
jgi:hypothetical protein